MKRPVVYVVLGMHRTGTSLAASMLDAAGLPMCSEEDRSRRDTHQPYGYFEDTGMSTVNRALLKTAGGSWAKVPSIAALSDATELLHDIMVQAIRERSVHDEWGFKDPRTSLTCFAWDRILREEHCIPRYVITYRDETSVIESLIRRNNRRHSEVQWARLYADYYQSIHDFLKLQQRPHLPLHYRELTQGDTYSAVVMLADWIGRRDRCMSMMGRVRRRE